MEVKEKRKALMHYDCKEVTCGECEYYFKGKCGIAHAPDEQIELWYGRAFPEKNSSDEWAKAIADAATALREADGCVTILEPVDERRVFSTGAVRDSDDGKGRMDLLPWAAILEVSKHSQRGAAHYGEHNIDKGIPTSQLLNSGMRHAAQHLAGWNNENHLVAAAWNLLWAVEMTLKHPELVDTPWMPEMDGAA